MPLSSSSSRYVSSFGVKRYNLQKYVYKLPAITLNTLTHGRAYEANTRRLLNFL